MALRQNPSKVVSDRHCSRANSGKKTKKTQNKTKQQQQQKKEFTGLLFFPFKMKIILLHPMRKMSILTNYIYHFSE